MIPVTTAGGVAATLDSTPVPPAASKRIVDCEVFLSVRSICVMLPLAIGGLICSGGLATVTFGQRSVPHPSFELRPARFDVDVDGAPNAYGPVGLPALDTLRDAHYRGRRFGEIVGYLTDDDHPTIPIRQGSHDPFPGYYISQTAYTDVRNPDERDPKRYVDATRINYVVLGRQARKDGAELGDFVAVYSTRTHRSVFGIVADDGNPAGSEGSLHLLQALGYPFHNGIDDAVQRPEIVIRYYPGSNPKHAFFFSQAALDAAATTTGISRIF